MISPFLIKSGMVNDSVLWAGWSDSLLTASCGLMMDSYLEASSSFLAGNQGVAHATFLGRVLGFLLLLLLLLLIVIQMNRLFGP